MTAYLPASRRPLTATERRFVRARIRSLAARGRRTSRAALPVTGGAVCLLWLWTLLASDAPWTVVTAFWVVVGAGLAWWVRRDMGRDAADLQAMAANLESALARDLAEVYDIRATSMVAFEEIEDEGACYAFELPGHRLVVVTGQEFYESARFPSLDFSLVYLLDERDRPVDMLIDKRGARAAPARTIPAATKRALVLPEHLEVLDGRQEELETLLSGLARPDR